MRSPWSPVYSYLFSFISDPFSLSIHLRLLCFRFNLGASGFEGAAEQEVREGPVQFEKDNATLGGGDVFGVDKFLDEAKRGTKRGLDTSAGGSRKRQQLDKSGDRD